MRSVRVVATVPGRSVDDVFEQLCDFDRYPAICAEVRKVSVTPVDEGRTQSSWEVDFRDGVMQWTEEDVIDWAAHALMFHQLSGDFEEFDGRWDVRADGDGCIVEFNAEFDVGMPSLGLILEPIAQESLTENIVLILRGLFGADISATTGA